MTVDQSSQFVEYLRQARHLKSVGAGDITDGGAADQAQGNFRRDLHSASNAKLWEVTDLSASEFADEVARFYKYERVALQDMLSATPLVASFSQRFLRETLVFPYQGADQMVALAIADPTDLAARRAAEIVLGPKIEIKVASFDDLTAVLDQRLVSGSAEARGDADFVEQLREDDIESLRDLASGAPVVRAVNDLLEKAIELRASDIHIEPFRTGLSCACGSTDCSGRSTPLRRAAAGRHLPASRSSRASTSRNADSRRTVPRGWPAASMSISA